MSTDVTAMRERHRERQKGERNPWIREARAPSYRDIAALDKTLCFFDFLFTNDTVDTSSVTQPSLVPQLIQNL